MNPDAEKSAFPRANPRYQCPSPMPEATDPTLFDRREFVGMLSAGGAGLFLEPFAKLFGLGPKAPPFDIPKEWLAQLGQPARGYSAFLGGMQLKRVSVRQMLEAHVKIRGSVANTIPPATLWRNMRPTLLVAEQIGNRLGENVRVVISAYRSPAYNARCEGAARDSQHVRNLALDLQFTSPPRRVAQVARDLRAEGKFRGGVGLYRGFVHVDTRGSNADWGRF